MGAGTTELDTREIPPIEDRRILLLNGPPNSGKDTLGGILAMRGYGRLYSFKKRLIEIALVTSGVTYGEWVRRYGVRELKETPWGRLGGLSQREYLIRISEDWVKPVFGEDYFGRAAVEDIVAGGSSHWDAIFTDSGFAAEVAPLRALSGNTVLVRLHREGCNFEGDSRGYLHSVCQREFDINVPDGQPEATADIIIGLLRTAYLRGRNTNTAD